MAGLCEVYTIPESSNRVATLLESFSRKYGKSPKYIARAPGRVNLIGEHIDYMGYGVLPMAIDQDILIAGDLTEEKLLSISNFDEKFEPYHCPTNAESLHIDSRLPKWYNYFLCGYRGIVEHLEIDGSNDRPGMNVMVCGNIPPSAGLSSSSALVCAAALLTSKLHSDKPISKAEFAQICCDCEKYIGTIGGGMDQSISFLAEAGKAKMIDFNPIRATDVTLPSNCLFVISHSLAELNKAATSHFNLRVVECRLACQVLAHNLGLPWRDYKRLGDLQTKLGKSLDEMLDMVELILHKEPYSKQEICDLLQTSAEDLTKTTLSQNTEHFSEFKLYQRAKHVFSEANRVLQFKAVCDSGDSDAAVKLGSLMNESHASTRDLYECSHPDLDLLVETCLKFGALGSRLTGAGWGGCAVSLIKAENLESFMSNVKADFYTADRLKNDISQVLFQSAPAAGACLYQV